jgi:hypothetical protein
MQLSLHFAAPPRDIVGHERQRIEKKLVLAREKRLSDAVAFCRGVAALVHSTHPLELVCQLAELIMERVGWLSSELFARLINLQ